jgi:hypothetical protein
MKKRAQYLIAAFVLIELCSETVYYVPRNAEMHSSQAFYMLSEQFRWKAAIVGLNYSNTLYYY